jgi:hypothetical protein
MDAGERQTAVARNALVPFLCLPEDMIIRIAREVSSPYGMLALNHRPLDRMTSVCSSLRTLLVNTPSLWTSVDFAWHKDIIERYVSRSSASHALHLHASLPCEANQEVWAVAGDTYPVFARCMPRTQFLTLDIEKYDRLSTMADVVSSELQDLTLFTSTFPPPRVDSDFLPSATWKQLLTLNIRTVRVVGIHPTTALRSLTLANTFCSLSQFHDIISHSPNMDYVALSYAFVRPARSRQPPDHLPVVYLRHLRELSVRDALQNVAQVVHMLPNPSTALQIDVDAKVQELAPEFGLGRHVAARAAQFWTSQGHPSMFPDGRVVLIAGLDTCRVIFDAVSFRYSHECQALHDNPLLALVTSLKVDCHDWPQEQMDPAALVFSCVPNVDHVKIANADWKTYEVPNIDIVNLLETWIVDRAHRKGRPFHHIEFWRCTEDTRPMYNRLLTGNVASSVTWESMTS